MLSRPSPIHRHGYLGRGRGRGVEGGSICCRDAVRRALITRSELSTTPRARSASLVPEACIILAAVLARRRYRDERRCAIAERRVPNTDLPITGCRRGASAGARRPLDTRLPLDWPSMVKLELPSANSFRELDFSGLVADSDASGRN